MGRSPGTPVSPYLYYSCTDGAGKLITMTITFDGSQNLTGATIFRDPACVYHNILIGLGANGTPDTTTMKFAIPGGTTTITTAQLNSVGLFTFADTQKYQVTAGF